MEVVTAERRDALSYTSAVVLKGASNGGYHYLGAAKIMAPIGKAFAESMATFQKTQGQEGQK